jgi:hypothetical protein
VDYNISENLRRNSINLKRAIDMYRTNPFNNRLINQRDIKQKLYLELTSELKNRLNAKKTPGGFDAVSEDDDPDHQVGGKSKRKKTSHMKPLGDLWRFPHRRRKSKRKKSKKRKSKRKKSNKKTSRMKPSGDLWRFPHRRRRSH